MNYSQLKFSYLDQLVITINLKTIRPDSVEIARQSLAHKLRKLVDTYSTPPSKAPNPYSDSTPF
jgi:hypothetical protein